MIRMSSWLSSRQILPPRLLLSTSAPNCASKQSLERKLGLPEKPKRPMTPFFRYLQKIRPSLQQKHPEAKLTDLTKFGAQLWAQATASERAPLEEQFKRELAAYSEAIGRYRASLSFEQKTAVVQAREDEREARERREMRKKLKDLGKPKRPPSGFLLFMKEKLATRGPQEDYKAFQERLSREWTALGDGGRSAWMVAAAHAQEAYRKDLARWQERMVRQGYADLLPQIRSGLPEAPRK